VFYDGIVARSEAIKLMMNYKTGQYYAYLGLAPHFLIFDEYVAFMECLSTRESIVKSRGKAAPIVIDGYRDFLFLT